MLLKKLLKPKYIYIYIFLFNLGLFILSTDNYKYLLMRVDQEIMIMTAAKMFYFDMNVFEAAWNHHTPPIFYLFRLIFHFTNFINVYEGLFVLYSALLITINILLYKLIYKLTDSYLVSFIFSTLFIFDLSHTTVGEKLLFDNRTIGIVFQILLLLYSFKIIENFNKKDAIIWSLITAISVFFLESYFISLLIIYIFLIFKLGKKFFIYSQITFLFSTAVYSLILFSNKELHETIQLNYVFHLFGTIRKRLPLEVFLSNGLFKETDVNSMFGLIFDYLNYHLFNGYSAVTFSSIFFTTSILFLLLFTLSKKFQNIYETKNILFQIFYIFFLSEIVHLFFTGPRFINYFQILLLFVYLVPVLTIFYLLKHFKRQNLMMFLGFLFLFFMISFNDLNEIKLYRFNNDQTVSNITSEQQELIDYINKNSLNSSENPELNYIWGLDNNFEVYFRTNTLPSSRMWWWFNMYYIESSIYTFDSDKFYSNNFEEIFISDLELEKPRFVIIQKDFITEPYFLRNYIEKNYYLSGDLDGFKIFEINN